jgi:hypothetical protein
MMPARSFAVEEVSPREQNKQVSNRGRVNLERRSIPIWNAGLFQSGTFKTPRNLEQLDQIVSSILPMLVGKIACCL